jgi:hypothetical protein
MAGLPWVKLYTEILHDPKMGRLSDHLWRRVGELFLMAQENNAGGYLPEVSDMAWVLRTSDDALLKDLEALAAPGVAIIKEVDKQWFVTNFAFRQDADSNAERQKRYRERKQKATYYGNDSVTSNVTESITTDNDSVLRLRVDVEGEEEEEREVEVTDDGSVTGDLAPLSIAFVNATKIPELTGGPQKWFDALEEMHKAGVSPADITQAVKEMRDRNYSIVSVRSIVNPSISVMSKRQGVNGKKRDYISGEFSDDILH